MTLVLAAWAAVACAAEPPADWELPTKQDELLQSLGDVAKEYGPDAVLMQAYLLNEAVRNGSVLEAEVSRPRFDERGGARFIAFTLDTGIVFNDRTVQAHDRPVRVWRDIVERVLRRYASLSLPAGGLALTIRYRHREYVDEWDLRDQPLDSRGTEETMAFYLTVADAAEFIRNAISPRQLIERSTVLRDGHSYALRLP